MFKDFEGDRPIEHPPQVQILYPLVMKRNLRIERPRPLKRPF